MTRNNPNLPELPSERVIIAAPMSFAGSAARIWRITAGRAGWAKAGLVTLAVTVITVAWAGIACWYLMWGLLLVPYRITRRGQRKRKLAARRHAEILAAARRNVP